MAEIEETNAAWAAGSRRGLALKEPLNVRGDLRSKQGNRVLSWYSE